MQKESSKKRKSLTLQVKTEVLTESGYRCAIPTCRSILAIDLHHLDQVSEGGGDDVTNLIALCPTCHALHHRGTIPRDALYVYKSMLVTLSHAFDVEAIDRLLFLRMCPKDYLIVSGDGLLNFSRLIAADLVTVELKGNNNWLIVTYAVNLSIKGQMFVDAWKNGNRAIMATALAPSPVEGLSE